MKTSPPAPRLSRVAIALTIILAAICASAFRGARIDTGGMLIHPYLPPMFLLFAFAGAGQLHRFPRDILIAILVFLALYGISALPSPGLAGELLKVVATFATAVTCALCIRSLPDFWAAVAGLNVAALVIAVKGLAAGLIAFTGYNPLEDIANKNAFSLYALPPVLLGAFVAIDSRAPRWFRAALIANAVLISFVIFSGANRSGWLGLILIGVALAGRGRRLRGSIAMAAVGGVVYLLLHYYGSTDVLEFRVNQTRTGYSSDTRREELFAAAMKIGMENPIMGVSPQQLPYDLARETRAPEVVIDPHNTFGLIIGGSGFVTLAAFLWLGLVVWRRPSIPTSRQSPARFATQLMRIQVVLFIVRGMFTREILYSPVFGAGFGLCIGLCLIEYRAHATARAANRRHAVAEPLATGHPQPGLTLETP